MVDFLSPLSYLHSRLLFSYSPTFQQFFNHISSARRRINGRRGNGFSWKLPSTQTIISLRRRIIPRLKHHHRGIRRWWLIARVSDEVISINYDWDARSERYSSTTLLNAICIIKRIESAERAEVPHTAQRDGAKRKQSSAFTQKQKGKKIAVKDESFCISSVSVAVAF